MHVERFVDLRQCRAVIGDLLPRSCKAFKRVTQEAQFPTHSIKSFYGIILLGVLLDHGWSLEPKAPA